MTARASTEAGSSIARELARFAENSDVISAIEWFRDQEPEFTRWQLELARIPAPPFGEAARSDWLAERVASRGSRRGSPRVSAAR